MFEKIRNYIEKGTTITLHNGRLITFYQFIIDRLERQYEMFEVLARDMVVHPETKESGHYLHHLKRKFITPHTPSFEKLYGRNVISRVLEDINLYRKTTRKSKLLNHRQMRALFKIAQLVIHHLSRNGGDMKLLEHNIRKQNYVIILTILQKSMNLKDSGSVKDRDIKRTSRNIMVNNKLTRHIEEVIRNNSNGIQLRLIKLAIHKQLDWVEKHYNHFNKNMSAYVEYKINMLKDGNPSNSNTDNTVALGLVYEF
ncbi:DUF4765 family protein [Salmonella enterica]|nr:DUF4765 family protein [Salmonella enterica]